MSNLFQQLEQEAFRAGITPRSKQSIRWFQNKLSTIKSVNRQAIMREDPITKMKANPSMVGSMFMYFYDPKLKKTLPYYDRFPLTVIVGPAEGGFYGINLHYLPMTLRAKFLDSLMERRSNISYPASNKKFDETTTFKFLSSASKNKYFKPCFKHYLTRHVQGQVALVPAPEWEIATFLPTAQFKKENENKIWSDSRKKING